MLFMYYGAKYWLGMGREVGEGVWGIRSSEQNKNHLPSWSLRSNGFRQAIKVEHV